MEFIRTIYRMVRPERLELVRDDDDADADADDDGDDDLSRSLRSVSSSSSASQLSAASLWDRLPHAPALFGSPLASLSTSSFFSSTSAHSPSSCLVDAVRRKRGRDQQPAPVARPGATTDDSASVSALDFAMVEYSDTDDTDPDAKRQRTAGCTPPEVAKSSVSIQEIASCSTMHAFPWSSSSASSCPEVIDPFRGIARTPSPPLPADTPAAAAAAAAADYGAIQLPCAPSRLSWQSVPVAGGVTPSPRCWAGACVHNNKLLILGGYDQTTPYPQDLHVYCPRTNQWSNKHLRYPDNRPARYAHTFANLGSRLFIFGGDSLAGYRDELFEVSSDLSTISLVATFGELPQPRAASASATIGSALYLSGGDSGNSGGYQGDMYVLNPNGFSGPTWSKIAAHGHAPDPRGWHTLSAVGLKLYLFGGYNGSTYFGDLHVFDVDTETWSQPPTRGAAPSPRHSHAAVVADDRYVVIVGGVGEGNENFDSVHLLDTATLTWIQPLVAGLALPKRHGHSLLFVPDGQQIYTFGGYDYAHLHDSFAQLSLKPFASMCEQSAAPACTTTITADLSAMVNNPAYSDVQFHLDDGRRVYAHRAILSARSRYFQAMFGRFSEGSQSTIALPDISSALVLRVFEYLYTGSTALTLDNAFDLLLAANMYNLDGLASQCEMFFECTISIESALSLYELAHTYHAPTLKKSVVRFAADNWQLVLDPHSIDTLPDDVQLSFCRELLAISASPRLTAFLTERSNALQ